MTDKDKSFKGFSTPNFTQTPNEFYEIIQTKGITTAEIKILAFMIRNTFGWQRAGFSLQFTFSEIQSETKLAREAISNGIKKCLDKGYIERAEVQGSYVYRIKMGDSEQKLPWDLKFEWKKYAKKEDKGSSEIEPRAVRKSNRGQFGNRTEGSSEIEPIKSPSNHEITAPAPGLKTSLNKSLNKHDKNNNKEKSPVVDDCPIQCFLNSKKLSIGQRTITSLKKKHASEAIIKAFEIALEKSTTNPIGYALSMLQNGFDGKENDVIQVTKQEKNFPEWIERQLDGENHSDDQITEEQRKEALALLQALGEL